MEEKEYQKMFEVEDLHWWYVGLRRAVVDALGKGSLRRAALILDAGCGTGGTLNELQGLAVCAGVDSSPLALGLCGKRGLKRLVNGDLSALPLKSDAFDAVVSLDVIYHRAVLDDALALREMRRVLKENGLLVLNLPAYEFLRSRHDEHVHTGRRYTKRLIRARLEEAGFKIERATYRNTLLFPLVLAVRLLGSRTRPGGSDMDRVSPLLNSVLTKVLLFETRLLRYFGLPFGSSVFCVARK